MSLNLSNLSRNDRVSKLSAIFNSRPELLYKNAYINFLREYRIRHLDLDIPELYHEAAVAWIKLSDKEKKPFRYLDVIRDVKHRRAMKEKRSKLAKKRRRSKRKVFNSRRAMRRIKKRIYPITTIRRGRPRKRIQIDKPNRRNLKSSTQNAERVRRILNRLRMIDMTPGRRRQRRRKSQQLPRHRQSVRRRRRQVNRRK